MRELKWTNKICGDCKNILAIIDGYRGYYCANCKCLWVRKDDNNRPVSKEEFDNLFDTTKDRNNQPVIRLKADKDVSAQWTSKFKERKKAIEERTKKIMNTTTSKKSSEDENEFDIEEIPQ